VRAEFLNAHWFRSLRDARDAGEEWRHTYHTTHAHSSLGYMTPEEILATYEITPSPQKSLAA
jgi:putative transposase